MANENHEQYDGNDISTYTDVINNLNMMSPDFIDGCTLSAGLLPCDNPKIQVTSQQPFEEGPNSLSPFYFDGGGALWFDETELSDATDSRFQYLHIVYSGVSDNQIASSLKVKNYRNFVTITQHTETINGTPYNYYELGLITKYGDNDDPESTWTNSVLKPMYVIPDNNMRTGFFAEEIMCVQECDFGSGGTHGRVCTNLNFQQGRRNLIDGSGTFVEKAIWFAGLGLPQGYHINGGTQYGSNYDHHLQWQNNPSNFYAGSVINNEDDLLMLTAICGLKFEYNNILYKPIVEGGIVTGYTSDMTETSEWDEWEDIGDHEIPIDPHPVPPPPEPGDDDLDDHKMGAGSGISGMANLWLLTKSQLDDLHGAFNSAPAGFDPLNSLISVMGLGVAPTYLFRDIQYITPINIRKSDGTSWSTGVEGHIVDSQKNAFQFTEIKVNRMYNNFLDYSPYAIHEIFIPMCGWLTLPDIAVDRSITVTYLPDVESLKCRAVVSVVDNSGNRCVIGEKDGIMGADVPFTNTGHSLYVGEAIINGMNVAGEVITGAIGAGFTKTNAKGGTYKPYEGFTVGMGGTLPGAIGNALVSGQTNSTHYMTGNGTRIGFSDGENIQIKSTYHKIDKPDNYDHTVGKVCNKTGLLSLFHGFTVCDNPHINISALEEEKSEIKALLEQGVILPSGE